MLCAGPPKRIPTFISVGRAGKTMRFIEIGIELDPRDTYFNTRPGLADKMK
jgi:hypothetical protein